MVAAIAQWIRLRLPSCQPGFQSQTHHLCFYQLIFELFTVEKTIINQKRPGFLENISLLKTYLGSLNVCFCLIAFFSLQQNGFQV